MGRGVWGSEDAVCIAGVAVVFVGVPGEVSGCRRGMIVGQD